MLDPEYLANVSEGAEEIASDLHTSIIKQIVKRISYRLGRGEDFSLSQTDRYQIEVLQEAGFLKEDILKEIAKETRRQKKEVKEAFEEAGVKSVRTDASVYEAVGISQEALPQSPALIRILQRGYEATMHEWNNYTRTTAISAQRLFINECDKAYNRVIAGEATYSEAYYDAVKNIAEGPGAVVLYPQKDRNGNPIPGTVGWTDTIEVATARAVRTGIVQATSDITATRAAENGVTCFLVSKHQGARPTHAEWQGQVYWVDWDLLRTRIALPELQSWPEVPDEERVKYREFCRSTGVGEMLGLCGINCRHSYGPFFDGISQNPYNSIDINEDPEIYVNEQKQRELERKIRKTRRELVTLAEARKDSKDVSANASLDNDITQKAKLLTRQNKAYKEFCDEHNLRPQEQRLAIAGWNREVVKEVEKTVKIEEAPKSLIDPVAEFKAKHKYIEGDYQANYEEAKKAASDVPAGFTKNAAQAYNLMRYDEWENCPTIVDSLDDISGPVLYRGIEPTKDVTAQDIIDNTKYGKYPYIGRGQVGGGGLYFTTSLETAKKQYGESIIEGKLLECKTIELSELRKEASKELGFANMPYSRDLSIYALEKGYDVIWTERNISGIRQFYINVLNRKVLATPR